MGKFVDENMEHGIHVLIIAYGYFITFIYIVPKFPFACQTHKNTLFSELVEFFW